jgi:hypothetical protein
MAELSSTLRHSSLAIQVAALAASGSSSSEFKRRVLRLLDNSPTPNFRLTRDGIVAMILATACLLMTPVVVQSLAEDVNLDPPAAEENALEGTDDAETLNRKDADAAAASAETAPAVIEAPAATDAVSEQTDQDDNEPAKARVINGFVTGPSGAILGVKVAVILSVALDGQQSVFGFNMGKTLKELAYTTDATKSAYRANWRRIQSCRSV